MTGQFARYGERETAVRYLGGCWYVVREQLHPHTRFTPSGPVTRQGRTMLVGIRQGMSDTAGFTMRRYGRSPFAP